MEMAMFAKENTMPCQDLTPSLPPLAFSLYTSALLSHCSVCFSPLPNPHANSSFPPHYCSQQCSLLDFPIHLSSAENYILQDHNADEDTSDLRAALRLLYHFERQNIPIVSGRIGGLVNNRDNLVSTTTNGFNKPGDNDEVWGRIRDGARVMAKARRIRDGLDVEIVGECEVEETILCVVLTNAVEVHVSGGPGVGIAVYDVAFSWINHSCSPNACYWFPTRHSSSGESSLLIVPASRDGVEATNYSNSNEAEPKRDREEHGPRIVVRSIKVIDEGYEVFIAYTDLLPPKAMRQSELWSKYRFVCSCQRCSTCQPTYVDRKLQEIISVDYDGVFSSSDYEDEAEADDRFSDLVEDVVNEYLTYGNPRSCCEKLERLLINGIIDEQLSFKETKLKHQKFLHPLHRLSLNAYMTLSSAYKSQASELLSLHPQMKSIQLRGFDMYKISAAYSLLLSGATHHLFLSESSLVVSVANFWREAGESLLNVARSSMWNSFPKLDPTTKILGFFHKYHYCASDSEYSPFEAFEEISREFIYCVAHIVPKVWPILVKRSCYLKLIQDPVDFSWVENIDYTRLLGCENNFIEADTESYGSKAFVIPEQDNLNLFQLGVYCLFYGSYLLSSFCGQPPDPDLFNILNR